MNWEAIGAIGEAAGAIGVVCTLIYLAAQIRQNTRTIKGQSLATVTQSVLAEVLPLVGNDIHRVYGKAVSEPDLLTDGELAQVDAWLIASFTARQNEYAQFKLGTLDRAVWESTHRAILENLGHEFGRRWWHVLGRHRFMPDFVDFVDSLDWRDAPGPSHLDLRLEGPAEASDRSDRS